ncbi:MAG TPA: RodZ domain-containing protein [Gammaproteobacteria bacterium]
MVEYSYGQELKSARERNGMSLQAVADALRLDPQLIEALELEDQKVLPAPAYVRGYIRAYAQLVRCPPETLIASYNAQARSEPVLAASVHALQEFEQERNARLMWLGTGIVLAALLVIVGGWLLIEHLTAKPVAPAIAVMENPEPVEPLTDSLPFDATAEPQDLLAETLLAEGVAPDASLVPPPAGAPTQPAPSVPAPASAQSTPSTQQAVPVQPVAPAQPAVVPADTIIKPVITNAQTGNDRLNLSFRGVSWVEVLDANGSRLVYGLFDAQTQPVAVKGQAPFEVTIGDATQVDIAINEQTFNSEPYMKRNNTARFRVESSVP